MSESIDWSALRPALDEMLANGWRPQRCADKLGVGRTPLRGYLAAIGVKFPMGRPPRDPDAAGRAERARIAMEARCQWAAVHHSNIVRGMIAQLQAAQREHRA